MKIKYDPILGAVREEDAGGGGAVASTDITDATAAGRALLTAADAAAQRTAIGAASLTAAQVTANAAAVAALTSSGVLLDASGATVLTKSGTATTFPGPVLLPAGSNAVPVLNINNTVGLHSRVNGSLNIGGISQFIAEFVAGEGLRLGSGQIGFGSTVGGNDLVALRGGPNIWDQRNGTAAQRTRIFNTGDATNGEWFDIDWQTTANEVSVGPRNAGTGVLRSMFLAAGGKGIRFSPAFNSISFSPAGGGGPVFTNQSISFDGWIGAVEYRLFGNNQSGITNRVGADVGLYPLGGSGSAATGQVVLYASLGAASGTTGHTFEAAVRTWLPSTGSPGLQFGGTTASFPGLRRSGVSLQARLADDSGFTDFQARNLIASGTSRVIPVPVGSLPSASASGAGAEAIVNDALSPAWGATVAGGGAVTVGVRSNGTNWIVF